MPHQLEPAFDHEGHDVLFPKITRDLRLSEHVADLVLTSIKSRQLKPGDRLPSERVLGEQFGVSRTVIREAARILSAKGVLEINPGSRTRVATMNAGTVREAMTLFLNGTQELNYLDVHEVRAVLEVHVAGVAAERATEQDIGQLEQVQRAMEAVIDDWEASAHADVELHRRVAKATHNELYVVMLDSIGDVLLEIRRMMLMSGEWVAPVLTSHDAIVQSIADRNPARARSAMQAHLDEIESAWRALAERTAGTTTTGETSG